MGMDVILPILSTSCIVISAVLMAIGWYFIRNKKKDIHMRIMITAAFFALMFFLIYLSKTIFIGDNTFGGPANIKVYYTVFLIFHIFLATAGAVFGVVTLTLAFRRNFNKHRKVGPWTATIWFCTAVTGITVYLLLYVFYPHGTTGGMIKAILGG